MVCFTVMDHDVLTANDFAGEAFLSLGSIPGVNSACNADNFHGLKQVELCLMHQKNKSQFIVLFKLIVINLKNNFTIESALENKEVN